MEEEFDVVDENDRVLRQLPRSIVHRQQLLHRAIHVFLFRPTGELLVHLRSSTKEEFPSVWTSSCSGHVSAGETYDESAPRELLEELGVAAAVCRIHKFAACPATSHEFTVLYSAISIAPVRPDPKEIAEIRWLLPQEIEAWVGTSPEEFSPAFRLLFGWYMNPVYL